MSVSSLCIEIGLHLCSVPADWVPPSEDGRAVLEVKRKARLSLMQLAVSMLTMLPHSVLLHIKRHICVPELKQA